HHRLHAISGTWRQTPVLCNQVVDDRYVLRHQLLLFGQCLRLHRLACGLVPRSLLSRRLFLRRLLLPQLLLALLFGASLLLGCSLSLGLTLLFFTGLLLGFLTLALFGHPLLTC